MKKDILDVLKIIFPILTFKYLWKALGNCWRILVLISRDGRRIIFQETVNRKKQEGAISAGDLYELQQKKEEWERAEQRTALEKAQGKHGFFMSCVMLMVNLFMTVFCLMPSLGTLLAVCEVSKVAAEMQAANVQTQSTETQNTETKADTMQEEDQF